MELLIKQNIELSTDLIFEVSHCIFGNRETGLRLLFPSKKAFQKGELYFWSSQWLNTKTSYVKLKDFLSQRMILGFLL